MLHSKEHTWLNAASGFHYHSEKADILPSEDTLLAFFIFLSQSMHYGSQEMPQGKVQYFFIV